MKENQEAPAIDLSKLSADEMATKIVELFDKTDWMIKAMPLMLIYHYEGSFHSVSNLPQAFHMQFADDFLSSGTNPDHEIVQLSASQIKAN